MENLAGVVLKVLLDFPRLSTSQVELNDIVTPLTYGFFFPFFKCRFKWGFPLFVVGSRPVKLFYLSRNGLTRDPLLFCVFVFFHKWGLKCSHIPTNPMQLLLWYSLFPSLTRPDSSVFPCQRPSVPPSASHTSCTSISSSCFWVSSRVRTLQHSSICSRTQLLISFLQDFLSTFVICTNRGGSALLPKNGKQTKFQPHDCDTSAACFFLLVLKPGTWKMQFLVCICVPWLLLIFFFCHIQQIAIDVCICSLVCECSF